MGRGYDLRKEPITESVPAKKMEKRETVSKPRIVPEIPLLPASPVGGKEGLPYTVQVASSQSEEKALALVNRLKAKGYPAYIEEAEIKGEKWYRVRVSSFRNKDDAQRLVDKLKEKEGLKESMVWKR